MRGVLPLLAVAAIGCSNLTDAGDGVVVLEVTIPLRLEVEVGDTIQLSARALDRSGAVVAANITWLTPDPTLLGVVAATGQITGVAQSPSARVQAADGTLVSDFLTFVVLGRADSLALPDSATRSVPPGTASTSPLTVQLTGAPEVSLAGHRLVFSVTAPAFADPATRTVQLANGALADTVLTQADGTPSSPVTLDLVAGATPPASATVQVQALRPSGAAIPGSGQSFAVTFQ